MGRPPGRQSTIAAALLALGLCATARAEADIRYVHDALGRLVGVIDHTGAAAVYRYDAVGNLLGIDRLPATTPAIIGMSPTEGPPGTRVTLDGVGFGPSAGANQAAVGGVPAAIVSESANRLVLDVPAAAVTGPITVTAPAGVATSAAPFVVVAGRAPRITGFAPAMGPVGAGVVVAGERFDTPATTTVTFNGRHALIGAVSASEIATAVPEGAGSGKLGVGTPWGVAHSEARFVVLPALLAPSDVAVVTSLPNPGAASVALPEPGKAAVALFDAAVGERLVLKLEAVTLAQSTVTVYGPDGRALASVSPGPSGGAVRFVVPATGTCTVIVRAAAAATGAMTLRLGIAALAVTGITVPAPVTTQQRITVTWTVDNEGSLEAIGTSWADRVYLTLPGACCADVAPAAHGHHSTAPLPPGASYTLSASFAVPEMPAGAYELTVIADPEDFAWGRDAGQSRRTVPVAVTTPDLAATALGAPPVVTTQATVPISWTVRNRGGGPTHAFGWQDEVYLSPTPGCCDGATRIASVRRTTPLSADTSYSVSTAVTIPNAPAGERHIVVVTDTGDEVYETREGNNDRAVPVTITTPDLTPTAFKTPAAVWARGSPWVSWTVTNAGSGAALREWTDRVYLSASATCCAGAHMLLAVTPAPGTAPGKSYTQIKKIPIPDLPAGAYYLFIRTDADGHLWEANETNNQMGAPVTLRRLTP